MRLMIQVRLYSDLASIQSLPGGTYIFSDLERLTPALSLVAEDLWNQLQAVGSGVRLLNHPRRALRRMELLQTLHAAGRNDFDVYGITDERSKVRFPVFVRGANDHEGSRTELLHSHDAVDANLRAAICYGHDPRELLIVEYLNAADSGGIHHKFGAFRVGEQIIPRQMIFSHQWILKYPDLIDGDKMPRERQYLDTNPHQAAIRETFDLAHLDYGRCDYAIINGRIQVWEINTNPIILRPPDQYRPAELPAREYFAPRIRAAYEAIDLKPNPQLKIPICFDRPLLDRILGGCD